MRFGTRGRLEQFVQSSSARRGSKISSNLGYARKETRRNIRLLRKQGNQPWIRLVRCKTKCIFAGKTASRFHFLDNFHHLVDGRTRESFALEHNFDFAFGKISQLDGMCVLTGATKEKITELVKSLLLIF